MPDMIRVWSKQTGRLHRVPEHFRDNPHLMKPFRLTPPADAAESATPSESWTVRRLRQYARDHHVDLSGVGRGKAALLERVLTPAVTVDTASSVPNSSDPAAQELSSGTVSDDENAVEA